MSSTPTDPHDVTTADAEAGPIVPVPVPVPVPGAVGPDRPARTSLIQCATCGVEADPSARGALCPICADERQYLPADGIQRWTDPEAFTGTISLTRIEEDLWGLDIDGGPGIGQRSKIIVTPAGSVMVDAPASISSAAVDAVRALGPLRAIIPTHPHMFGLQTLWSAALDDAPILVSAADAQWLGHRPPALRLWEGQIEPVPGVLASQPGGHFPGSSVVFWPGADGKGVLLSGDTIAVNPDLRTTSFLRSYPNKIPLSAAVLERIAAHVERYTYDRIHGNFQDSIVAGAQESVRSSARRYAAWVRGEFDHLTGEG